MYKIYGKYQNGEPEVIDEFNTEILAYNMLNEYKMAYGFDWELWVKKSEEE